MEDEIKYHILESMALQIHLVRLFYLNAPHQNLVINEFHHYLNLPK
jgi:hypothetical protein